MITVAHIPIVAMSPIGNMLFLIIMGIRMNHIWILYLMHSMATVAITISISLFISFTICSLITYVLGIYGASRIIDYNRFYLNNDENNDEDEDEDEDEDDWCDDGDGY